MFSLFVTLDIDYDSHTDDEARFVGDSLLPLLKENRIRVTWFVRIDRTIERDFGAPDSLFRTHAALVRELMDNGHTIGWHPHVYSLTGGTRSQNTNEDDILAELGGLLPFVRRYDISLVRMGWGFQTNRIMRFLDEQGFIVDSSAIPGSGQRPAETERDWASTSNEFYHPSKRDYRMPDEDPLDNLGILEVPMTTLMIKAPYDEAGVLRYCNLAYRTDALEEPLDRWIGKNDYLVTITHPYELGSTAKHRHPLFSYDLQGFCRNLGLLESLACKHGKRIIYRGLLEASDRGNVVI